MIVLYMLITVSCWAWMFRWLGPIHLIARLLINWICVWIVKWNTILSHLWKLFQMALMKEKNYWTYITKHLQAW